MVLFEDIFLYNLKLASLIVDYKNGTKISILASGRVGEIGVDVSTVVFRCSCCFSLRWLFSRGFKVAVVSCVHLLTRRAFSIIVSVRMNEDAGELQGDTTDCSYFEFKNCRKISSSCKF